MLSLSFELKQKFWVKQKFKFHAMGRGWRQGTQCTWPNPAVHSACDPADRVCHFLTHHLIGHMPAIPGLYFDMDSISTP